MKRPRSWEAKSRRTWAGARLQPPVHPTHGDASCRGARNVVHLGGSRCGDWHPLAGCPWAIQECVDGQSSRRQGTSALEDDLDGLKVAKEGLVEPERKTTMFELYVSRPVSGTLIDAFNAARTHEDAVLALEKARHELWGDGPDLSSPFPVDRDRPIRKRGTRNRGLSPRADRDGRPYCGSGSPQADIEAAIRQGPVSDAKVFTIADKMCGWVKRQVDKQLERGLPALVQRDDFHREYVAFVRSVDRDIILRSFAKKPSQSDLLRALTGPICPAARLDRLGVRREVGSCQ